MTGGSGRLGTALVKELLARGKKVKVLARDGNAAVPPGALAHIGDVTKPETLAGLVGKGDTVFHLAGIIDEGNSYETFYRVNVLGTENALDACSGNGVKRFVFVSSISVFGELEYLPGDERCEKKPITRYGKSKMLAEEAVMRKWKTIPSTIIRPGMVYGPGFDEGYLPVLKMLENGKMPVLGGGGNRIPLIHVSDAVAAMVAVSESDEAVRKDFVVAGPGNPTQKELLAMASEALGVEPPKRSVPVWLVLALLPLARVLGKADFSPENVGQLTRDRMFDCSKIKKAAGFEPKVPLSQGIKEMVAYYRQVGR